MALCCVALMTLSARSDSVTCGESCKPDSPLLRTTRNFEGLRLFPYSDVAGHETIGFGHLIKPDEDFSDGITGPEAELLLELDEKLAGDYVLKMVKVKLTQGQYNALTDFVFNLGPNALKKSSLLSAVNARNNELAVKKFMLYDKARVGGVLEVIDGLFSRRKAEADMYQSE